MERLKSRKLWVTLITAALVALNKKLGLNLSEQDILALAGLSAAYVIGLSYKESRDEQKAA